MPFEVGPLRLVAGLVEAVADVVARQIRIEYAVYLVIGLQVLTLIALLRRRT